MSELVRLVADVFRSMSDSERAMTAKELAKIIIKECPDTVDEFECVVTRQEDS